MEESYPYSFEAGRRGKPDELEANLAFTKMRGI